MRIPARPSHSFDHDSSEKAAPANGGKGVQRPDTRQDPRAESRPAGHIPRSNPVVTPRIAQKPAAAEPPVVKNPVPSWLQPFTLPTNTRFTRTPDYLLRPQPEAPAAALPDEPEWTVDVQEAQPAFTPSFYDERPSYEEEAFEHEQAEHEQAEHGQPSSIRRIAGLIKLDWDQPPVVPAQHDRVARAPEPEPEREPEPLPAQAPAFLGTPVPLTYSWAAYTLPNETRIAVPRAVEVAPEPLVAEIRAPEPRRGAPPLVVPPRTAAPARPAPQAPVAQAPVAQLPAPAPAKPAPRAVPVNDGGYELPPLELLAEPPYAEPSFELSEEFLDRNSVMLQQILHDFNVRGEIIDANPGPVVTLYELEPAPGVKSSRVVGLSDDIARSMSAVSARVAVIPGRNVIGIELPNQTRETVWLRELMASHEFDVAKAKLALCLGKTIGGEPVIADLARMPHLLVAGTTGSGKSVAINTMILSLLYRHRPEECRLIMIDPKMLELSVYEGIPHLLTPVVTDPKKAIIALKWAVREMEERYKKMSRLGVRNIDGYNARVSEARANGEIITRTVQTGFDRETGQVTEEDEIMDLSSLPYIVIIVDEMADLMMVAGKDIEGAIQRLAQMARAAGIHIIMATQRPSVDVITGTIKANFPTRISFQVTSKIDSRTILGEMGAEQLLGQGDMLYMAGGGRIGRVHGPFVSDLEVEKVVAHLKRQGRPEYVDAVTAGEEEEPEAEDAAVFDKGSFGEEGTGDLYDQAIAIVMRDRKASTSYIQRRLQIGYNRAASIMERMENEGIVGPANHAGKREILMDAR